MSRVAEIIAAIECLSPQERCELEALLHPQEDDAWDLQMKENAKPGGKLHKLAETSRKMGEAGQLFEFPLPHSNIRHRFSYKGRKAS